ncbi:hypothetical protein GH714_016200 [Hevea brasiliensis]|uniref:Uncharacterized protein n=1 Tax=Hevea brasiliensis TaxID=3981 RepID=A0A6A6M2V5_HEVBR|nr:hypothetical protein GH714_016200 [Hevea brasiliensis]
MGCPSRKVCDKFLGFFSSWRRNTPPTGRRIFHRDVEQDDFQYASTHCLSSYYSVFVVRLAIMVMLAILIGLLTILTWHFTRSYTKRSLDTLASGLRYELLQRPILRMWNILNSTSEITTAQVKLSEYVIRRYSKPATQADKLSHWMRLHINSHKWSIKGNEAESRADKPSDARRRAEASNNYKSQFLANMSHELRTPMAAVIGLLDILISDDCLTNEQYATVTQIRKCSTALLRLLNNILDLSKVESGKLVLEDTEFDLGRELEGLMDMFSVQCINHNVEAVLDLSDDMPKFVRGDSARVVQIFANLISNSIKFTTSGHIVLRGWCEIAFNETTKFPLDQKKARCALKTKLRQQGNHMKKTSKKENKVILWFEVDDTGCGIDPSKWESVFESFEQADPSTTRLHGGTGLGLCIVRTLVHKMGGEIKVVKKNGPGTLMRLYLLLSTTVDGAEQNCQVDFARHNVVTLLALYGSMGRVVMSQWLRKIGLPSLGVSEWNELTQVLQELFYSRRHNSAFEEQLNFLDKFSGKATFAWMLNHDTSNAIKMELRRKGHILMVNKPLYKAKMIQILETVIKEQQKKSLNAVRAIAKDDDIHECLEIDSIQFDNASSEDSDMPEMGNSNALNAFLHGEKQKDGGRITCPSQYQTFKGSLVELTDLHSEENNLGREDTCQINLNLPDAKEETAMLMNKKQAPFSTVSESESSKHWEQHSESSCPKGKANSCSSKAVNERKALEGLRILLAEDTPVLQRVAAIMLEKMGATVTAVGDGLQAVDALNCLLNAKEGRRESLEQDGNKGSQTEIQDCLPYDLILMDCQMPKMDGYEATKAIRKSEAGTGFHIPIVALTAHAMSSDEAKCLEVGMDAYLTKPIDYKLMMPKIDGYEATIAIRKSEAGTGFHIPIVALAVRQCHRMKLIAAHNSARIDPERFSKGNPGRAPAMKEDYEVEEKKQAAADEISGLPTSLKRELAQTAASPDAMGESSSSGMARLDKADSFRALKILLI